jgi:enoyl-CoA hydratase/carnithine racemase
MSAHPLPDAPAGTVGVRRDGPVAWVVLDRPGRRNALSPAMWAALPGILAALDADPTVRVIGVRGAGGVFSAGADLTEVFDCLGEPGTGLPRGGLLSDAEAALAGVRKPTVAALEGWCMGGAWMLAAACDLRIAATGLRIGLTPARIGIVFPASGVRALVRLVGPGVASYLLLTGDTVTAAEADRWGMLTRVVAEADFEEVLDEVVTGLAQRSQLSMQAHKHLLRQAGGAETEAGGFGTDAISEALFRQVLEGPDARIGQRAFLAKEAPVFEWAGEDFWAARATPARARREHRASIIRGRWPRRSARSRARS